MPRLLVAALIASACARPEANRQPQPRGVQIENVTLTTWRGPLLTSRGTAKSATLTIYGFRAEGVAITLSQGTTLTTQNLQGELDGRHATAETGVGVQTPDGCRGQATDPVTYADDVVTTSGPVHARGCGFELDGQRLTYRVPQREAIIDGPVRTRIEACPEPCRRARP